MALIVIVAVVIIIIIIVLLLRVRRKDKQTVKMFTKAPETDLNVRYVRNYLNTVHSSY